MRCGPLIHDAEATTAEISSDLLPDTFINHMICETNTYADHFLQDIKKPCHLAQDSTGGKNM